MDINEKALELHKQWNGKLTTEAKSAVKTREDLSLAYTPGVAEPCKVIAKRSCCCLHLHNESKYRCRCF